MAWDGAGFARSCTPEADPWALLEGLSEAWIGTRRPGGFPVIPKNLPAAVQRWYRDFAGHPRLSNSKQDSLKAPDALRVQDGMLTFLVENQGVWRAGLREADLTSPDPRVHWTSDDGKTAQWLSECSFSRFALTWGGHSIASSAPFSAGGCSPHSDLSKLFSVSAPIPLPELRMFGGAIRFRGGPDLLVEEQDFEGAGGCDYLFLAALSRSACEDAMARVEVDWDVRPD